MSRKRETNVVAYNVLVITKTNKQKSGYNTFFLLLQCICTLIKKLLAIVFQRAQVLYVHGNYFRRILLLLCIVS